MGYYGRLELKLQARKMRSLGKSYGDIIHTLKLSKSTVSDWCHDVRLTKSQLNHLYRSKISGALKGSVIAARNKQEKRIKETKELFLQGKKEIGFLSKRDRFLAGIAFYASEGTKSDKGCSFANSDPTIIKFMVDWFREFGHVPQNKFHGAIWLHEGLKEDKARKFWSKLTRIPSDHFYKTYIALNKPDSKKIRKNIHQNGVFSLYVSDVVLYRKIRGWIGGVLAGSMV
jgi:hypothetical protein